MATAQDLPSLDGLTLPDQQPVLLFGWRPKPRRLEAGRMSISDSVGDVLLGFAKGALGEVQAASRIEFAETRLLDTNEVFVSSLDEYRAGEDDSATDLEAIVSHAAAQFATLSPEQIKGNRFAFYVVVADDDQGIPVAFVKMPYKMTVVSPGRVLVGYSNQLTRIETPTFALSDDFDLVVRGQDVFVLNSENYLRLLSDAEILQGAAATFVATIQSAIPIQLDTQAVENIQSLAESSPRVARQLRRISRANYLSDITGERLAAEFTKFAVLDHGLEVDADVVVVPDKGVDLFLKIVEQVVWRTPFNDDVREAQAYASM